LKKGRGKKNVSKMRVKAQGKTKKGGCGERNSRNLEIKMERTVPKCKVWLNVKGEKR